MAGFNPDDYNGGQLVVASIVFLALTYFSVGIRFACRVWIMKSYQWDDWFILVSQGIFTLSCSFILRGVYYGLGHHDETLSQENRTQSLKYQTLATITYVANMMFIKLSIAVFLLRIATKKRYVWTLKASMAIVTIWSLAIFFFELFQCSPVQAQWDLTIEDGKCAPPASFVAAAYSISVLTVVTDWLYAIIPIPMIWNVQMSVQKKVTVAFVLSLGVFASIATLIRLKYLIDLSDNSDILFTGSTAMLWTLVEPGVAITAASLITIRPLLRALNFKGFSNSTSPSSQYHSSQLQSHTREQSHQLAEWNNLSIVTGPETLTKGQIKMVSETASEEFILGREEGEVIGNGKGEGESGIKRTRTVTVVVGRESMAASRSRTRSLSRL